MKGGTICERSYRISYIGINVFPFNYSFRREKLFKIIILNIQKRNTVFSSSYIHLVLVQKRYFGDWFLIIWKVFNIQIRIIS